MRPEDLVLAFADHVTVAVAALRANSAGVDREAAWLPLMFTTDSGQRLRSVTLDGVGVASLHGRGCRIEFDSGAEIDFDWDDSGREVFNGWRLRRFANSVGQRDLSEEELVTAARSDTRLLEPEPGWFALVLHTHAT